VTTNNPRIFKATIYKAARRLGLPVHIYSFPRRPKSFALLKRKMPIQVDASEARKVGEQT